MTVSWLGYINEPGLNRNGGQVVSVTSSGGDKPKESSQTMPSVSMSFDREMSQREFYDDARFYLRDLDSHGKAVGLTARYIEEEVKKSGTDPTKLEGWQALFERLWSENEGDMRKAFEFLGAALEKYGKRIFERISEETGVEWRAQSITFFPSVIRKLWTHESSGSIFVGPLKRNREESAIFYMIHELTHENTESIKRKLRPISFNAYELATDLVTHRIVVGLNEEYGLDIPANTFHGYMRDHIAKNGYEGALFELAEKADDFESLYRMVKEYIAVNHSDFYKGFEEQKIRFHVTEGVAENDDRYRVLVIYDASPEFLNDIESGMRRLIEENLEAASNAKKKGLSLVCRGVNTSGIKDWLSRNPRFARFDFRDEDGTVYDGYDVIS